MQILVLGCEHSGSRWLAHLVGLHPLVSVEHRSFPSNGDFGLADLIESMAQLRFDGVVFVFRDASAIRASQRTAGSYDRAIANHRAQSKSVRRDFIGSDLVETWTNAAELLASDCDAHSIPWALASYETTLQSRTVSLTRIFRCFCLDELQYQYFAAEHGDRTIAVPWDGTKSTHPVDGNKKYFVMPGVTGAFQHLAFEIWASVKGFSARCIRFIGRRIRSAGRVIAGNQR